MIDYEWQGQGNRWQCRIPKKDPDADPFAIAKISSRSVLKLVSVTLGLFQKQTNSPRVGIFHRRLLGLKSTQRIHRENRCTSFGTDSANKRLETKTIRFAIPYSSATDASCVPMRSQRQWSRPAGVRNHYQE